MTASMATVALDMAVMRPDRVAASVIRCSPGVFSFVFLLTVRIHILSASHTVAIAAEAADRAVTPIIAKRRTFRTSSAIF